MSGGEARLWQELEKNRTSAGTMCTVNTPAGSLVLLPLTCVTEYGPNEAWRLAGGERWCGGTMNRFWEKEKGLELEKRGPSSACDRGRRRQV